MALYNNQVTDQGYYTNDGNLPENLNWGGYQYVSLLDVVNNFMLIYQGDHELVNNISRHKVLFYAKRCIQELNYDAAKEVKALLLNTTENLRFVLPPDYVNWVRISMYKNGLIIPLTQNIQANTAKQYLQNSLGEFSFDVDGKIIENSESILDAARKAGTQKSIYLNENSPYNGATGYFYEGNWIFDCAVGGRPGLNTETANQNPTFAIDSRSGVINFSSDMSGQPCLLEYISDGMSYSSIDVAGTATPIRTDENISLNKMFEEYAYAYIRYQILDNKLGIQEYIVNRARKKKHALWLNAKLRISNLKPGRLLMNMRGQDKQIK
jgi:hypothetical protein|tara:strand:- start:865 stop:1836 length:972 start_codon:yes stop_codon:yes gene_type:complete